jgi:hypothetical protein
VHQIFSIEPVHGALSVPLIFIALESIDWIVLGNLNQIQSVYTWTIFIQFVSRVIEAHFFTAFVFDYFLQSRSM